MVIGILSKATEDLGGAFSVERIAFSLKMTLLGLGAVFAVLALIWLVLALFKFFLFDLKNKKDKNVKAKVANNVTPSEPVKNEKPVEVTPVAANNTSDDATVAAIMAAISAYISEDPELSREYSGGFRVVSFKRVRAKASWNNINN